MVLNRAAVTAARRSATTVSDSRCRRNLTPMSRKRDCGTVAAFGLPTCMTECKRNVHYLISTLILTGFMLSARAQEVSIPDPGLNAAVRAALQKPSGPL